MFDERDVYGGTAIIAPSPHNILTQTGSNNPISYTLNFGLLQDSISFTRATLTPSESGITHPQWHAYVYDASNNLLDDAGESLIASFSIVPAATFTLTGPGIAKVRIDSNGNNFAAFSAIQLDNLVLSNGVIPEPSSLMIAATGIVSILGCRFVRRRRLST